MATMEETLEQAYTALTNAASVEQISVTLAAYGYGPERLQEGMALYDVANRLLESQDGARLSKRTAFKSFRQLWQQAQVYYQNDLTAARLALKEHTETRDFLQLKGARATSFSGWYEQAKNFYHGLQNQTELQTIVATLGLTPERIEAGVQTLQLLKNARLEQRVQTGSSGDIRRQRDDAFQALNQWMSTFRQIARIALATTPDHLATLALVTESRKQKKKETIMLASQSMQTMQSNPTLLGVTQ